MQTDGQTDGQRGSDKERSNHANKYRGNAGREPTDGQLVPAKLYERSYQCGAMKGKLLPCI